MLASSAKLAELASILRGEYKLKHKQVLTVVKGQTS